MINESNIIDKLETMRYKYLSMKHDNMPTPEEVIEELVGDMTLICHILKRLINPLAE